MRGACGISGVCLVFAVACGARESLVLPDLTLRWESAHFSYYSAPDDDSVCRASIDELEAHFAAVVPYLGLDWPAGRKITYYKVEDFDVGGHCGLGAAGCVVDGNVYASEPVLLHELVHAYLAIEGEPPRVLEEGAAVLLTEGGAQHDPDWVEQGARSLTWPELLAWPADANDSAHYAAAVRLVDTLVRMRGLKTFVQLYRALDGVRDVRRADSIASSVLGTTFEQAWAQTLARPFQPPPSRTPFECGASAALDVARTVRKAAPDCEFEQFLHFNAAPDGLTTLRTTGSGFYDLASCDSAEFVPGMAPRTQNRRSGVVWLAALAAGAYYVGALPEDALSFAVGTDQQGLFPTCAEAEAAPLGSEATIVVSLPSAHPAGYLAIDVPAGMSLSGYEQQSDPETGSPRVRVCASCADLGACEPLGVNDYAHRVGDAGHYVVVVGPDVAEPWPFVNARFEIE